MEQLRSNLKKIYQSVNWLFMAVVFIFIVLVAGMELFGCSNRPAVSGVFGNDQEVLASRDATESSGIFESADGRLNSDDLCYNNESCVEMCDSMLKDFSDQKRCYAYQEVEVQEFRDIYNELALGQHLGDVDSDEMESFLDFGVELWRDAITGFERDWEDGCTVDEGERLSDCQGRNYYLQRGYTRQSAADVLSWIARNDWLAKLLLDYDNNLTIMDTLVDILIDPNIPNKYRHDNRNNTNSAEVISSIEDFPDECQTADGNNPDPPANRVDAFKMNCLAQGLNYESLAEDYDNDESVQLGDRYCRHISCP